MKKLWKGIGVILLAALALWLAMLGRELFVLYTDQEMHTQVKSLIGKSRTDVVALLGRPEDAASHESIARTAACASYLVYSGNKNAFYLCFDMNNRLRSYEVVGT